MKRNAERNSRRTLILALIGLVAVAGLTGCDYLFGGGGPSGGRIATDLVSIRNMSFQPADIQVTVGTTVTWQNSDGVSHTVTSDGGAFASGLLKDGDSFTFTFTAAGTFTYHCAVHPSMRGSVLVTP